MHVCELISPRFNRSKKIEIRSEKRFRLSCQVHFCAHLVAVFIIAMFNYSDAQYNNLLASFVDVISNEFQHESVARPSNLSHHRYMSDGVGVWRSWSWVNFPSTHAERDTTSMLPSSSRWLSWRGSLIMLRVTFKILTPPFPLHTNVTHFYTETLGEMLRWGLTRPSPL